MVETATRPDTRLRGTGFKAGIKKSKSKGPKSPATNSTSVESVTRVIHIQPTVTCPECSAKISCKTGRLAKHIEKVHGPDAVALQLGQGRHNSAVAVGSVRPELHVCTICGVLVKSLEKHAKRTGHGTTATLFDKAVQRSKGQSKQSPSGMLNCPHCRATFPNATQLASHVAGTHGKRNLQNLGYQARSGSIREMPNSPRTAVDERQTNLDAKHGWGGSFRDHGQFGSYPSHDAMDDESSA